jgi:hypothetical protein
LGQLVFVNTFQVIKNLYPEQYKEILQNLSAPEITAKDFANSVPPPATAEMREYFYYIKNEYQTLATNDSKLFDQGIATWQGLATGDPKYEKLLKLLNMSGGKVSAINEKLNQRPLPPAGTGVEHCPRGGRTGATSPVRPVTAR